MKSYTVVRHYETSPLFWTGYKWSPEASDALVLTTFSKARACWEHVLQRDVNANEFQVIEDYGLDAERVAL